MNKKEMLFVVNQISKTFAGKMAEDAKTSLRDEKILAQINSKAPLSDVIKLLRFQPDAIMLVHPRNMGDVYNRCSYLRRFKEDEVRIFLENLWPLVLDKATYRGKNILVFTLPLLPEYWFPVIDDRERHKRYKEVREQRWRDALTILRYFEEKIGLMPIILGALTGRMNKYLSKNGIKSPLINGTRLTPHIIADMIKQIAKISGKNINDFKIVLIGGAGKMGMSVLELLLENINGENIIVIEANQKRLEMVRQIFDGKSNLLLSINLQDLKNADIAIVTTAGSGTIIDQNLLAPGTIVIDDTHPSNVAQNIPRSRNIILRVMTTVPKLEYDFPMDQLGSEECVTCLAEGCIFTQKQEQLFEKTQIKEQEQSLISVVGIEAKTLGIKTAPLRDKDGLITEANIYRMSVADVIKKDWRLIF